MHDQDRAAVLKERKQITSFGVLLTGFLGFFGCIAAHKGNASWPYLVGIGAGLGFVGLVAPSVLRPLYLGWMKLARYLGWFTTRLVLTIFYFIVLTPYSIMARLLGKDLLDERIDRSAKSYWHDYPEKEHDAERYTKRF